MIGRAEVVAAHGRIAPYVRRTPIMEAASPAGGAPVSLKLEFLQHTGAFKARGAFSNLVARAIPPVGCAAASGGNHGAAVAFAASRLGVKAKVFVPRIAAPIKIAKILSYGAEAHVEGDTYFDALALAQAHIAKTGALSLEAYDSIETIAGQGTIGKEWEEDLAALNLAPLDTVVAGVGGGGLASGLAAWFSPGVRVVCVEPEGSRALNAALEKGCPVDVPIKSIAADSLGARRVGALNFELLNQPNIHSVLVSDAAIREAQQALWRDFSIVSEPGGAAAYAALMCGAYAPEKTERVGVLLCGANADLSVLTG